MEHTYTDHQVIRFIYNEMCLFDKLEMEFAMEEDSTLLDKLNEFKEAFNILPRVTFSPKKSGIQNILDYSKQSMATGF